MAISLTDLPEKARLQITAKLLQAKATPKPDKPAKYRNRKTVYNGITFDSELEARRYQELMCMLSAGMIRDLKLQESLVLQNAFVTPQGERIRAISYRADFTYTDVKTGHRVIEDAKGYKTEKYKIKRKLAAEKGLYIKEIT